MEFRNIIVKSYRIVFENAQKNAQKISFLTQKISFLARENSLKSIRYVFFDVSIPSVSHSIIELFEEIRARQPLVFEAKLTRVSPCFTIKQFFFSEQSKFTIRANRSQTETSFLIDSASSFPNSFPSTSDKRQASGSINSVHVSIDQDLISSDLSPLQTSSDECQSSISFYLKRPVSHTNRPIRVRQSSTRYQHMIDVSI